MIRCDDEEWGLGTHLVLAAVGPLILAAAKIWTAKEETRRDLRRVRMECKAHRHEQDQKTHRETMRLDFKRYCIEQHGVLVHDAGGSDEE